MAEEPCAIIWHEQVYQSTPFTRTRAGNPHFYELLDKCADLHETKNLDYADADNAGAYAGLDNFVYAASYAGVSPRVVFDVLLGVKQARLRNLESHKAKPNHESIEDTYTDFINYLALRTAFAKAYPDLFDRPLSLAPRTE